MSAWRDMNMTNLYSSLGYRKNSNPRYEALDATAHSFFREYTDRGNKISADKTELEGARLCALNFLHEDDRGEHFWPANFGGTLEWANDEDRETIIEILTHVFRLKSFSDYVKAKKLIRDRKRRNGEAKWQQWLKPKRVKKRTWKLREDDDEDYRGHTTRESTQNVDAFIPSSLEPTTVKPWNNPPEEPSAKFCSDYIKNLNPRYDTEPVGGFKKRWLSKNCAEWPPQADQRLLRFMFDHDFFITYDYGDDLPAELLRSLRRETEIEQLRTSEFVEFRNRVKSRVVELTKLLTTKPYFILAYRRDGVVEMTQRFERMWKRKDIYWEEEPPKANAGGPRPVKKRKKSKLVRAKTPIIFPNLRDENNAMSELLSAQVDINSRIELASMAETALELSMGQEELQTQWFEPSFFDAFMNDDSEFGLDFETRERTVSKSASPDDIIVADSRITESAEVPNSTLSISPSRESQHTEEETSRSRTLESRLSIEGETQQHCVLNTPISSQPLCESPSQDGVTETERTSDGADGVESPAKNARDPISTFFTTMDDVSNTGCSRDSPNQSVSPSRSITNQSSGRTNSSPTNTSFSQHLQQDAPTSGDYMFTTCPPKGLAEFSGLDPQRPIATGTAQDETTAYEKTPGFSSNPEHVKYHSPYLVQSSKDPKSKSADRQNSSSLPGSSRSSPLEIVDDSDPPQLPSSSSTKLSSTIAKSLSPQAENNTDKPVNEDLPAAMQTSPGHRSSQNSMSLNNILGPEIEFTPIKLFYHHHTIGKKSDAPSAPSNDPPPPLHWVHTSSSQPAQSSPSHGSIASNSHAPDPGQQRAQTSANPYPSNSDGCYASFPELRPDPARADAAPSLLDTFSAPPAPSLSPSMVQTPSNNNTFPAPDVMQNLWPNWSLLDTPTENPSAANDLSRNYVQASGAPIANMYSESCDSNSSAQVRIEPTEKSTNSASALNLSPAQHDERVDQSSTVSYAQQSKSTIPTEKAFQSKKLPDEQSSHQFSESRRVHDIALNTSPVSATPLILDTRTEDSSKSTDVDDFVSSIDDFIRREGASAMQKVPSDPAPPTNTTDQPCQLRSHSPQGESSEAEQMQASQKLHSRGQTPNSAVSPGAQAKSPNSPGVTPSKRTTFETEQVCRKKSQSPSSEGPLIEELSKECNESTLSPRTRPAQNSSCSQDLTPRTERSDTLLAQDSMAPPIKDTPKRNGSYSFVPPPEAFSTSKSEAMPAPAEARPPPAPVPSTDRRLATRNPSSAGNVPILTLLIESADGNVNLDATHSFDIVKNSSSLEFFQFYSSISGTPLSSLTSLDFQVAFGKRQNFPIRRYGSEEGWTRLREVIPSLFDRAVRKDTHGRMEWQVLVSSE